jgi:hypothetical protein
MFAKPNPGFCGTAARLPNSPGTQKLTPPSSAIAVFGKPPKRVAELTNAKHKSFLA